MRFALACRSRPGTLCCTATRPRPSRCRRQRPGFLALSGRKPDCFNDLAGRPAPWARAATDAGLVSACVFVVFGGGEPIGALAFFFDHAMDLDQWLSTFLSQLAMQLGRAVERQQADMRHCD